jgi:hypothetical protein
MPIIAGRERADRDVFVRSTYAGRMYKRSALVGPWKLTQDVALGTVNLYRLARDPDERTDLAAAEPAQRQQLLARLGHVFDLAMNDQVLEGRAARRRK